jgi:5-methylcytosine-specific restriction endonuclease McrA
MYCCEYCNFKTDFQSVLYNHNKSKKHLNNHEIYLINQKTQKQQENELEILKKKYYKVKKQKNLFEKEKNILEIKVKQLENEKIKSDVLINFYKENYIKPKYKKETIPKSLKIVVWNKYFGEATGKIKCPCCNITEITQLKFHCGHIIAEKNGGTLNIDNLMPICESCNKSMGTQNLHDFRKKLHEIIE